MNYMFSSNGYLNTPLCHVFRKETAEFSQSCLSAAAATLAHLRVPSSGGKVQRAVVLTSDCPLNPHSGEALARSPRMGVGSWFPWSGVWLGHREGFRLLERG